MERDSLEIYHLVNCKKKSLRITFHSEQLRYLKSVDEDLSIKVLFFSEKFSKFLLHQNKSTIIFKKNNKLNELKISNLLRT